LVATAEQVDAIGPVVPYLRLGAGYVPAGASGETRLDLVHAIRSFARRAQPPTNVIVVVPAPDVLDTVQTVLEDPAMRRVCVLDAVVATVDARVQSTRTAIGAPICWGDERPSLAIADRIAVTRGGDLTESGRAAVRNAILDASPFANVLIPCERAVDVADLVGLDAWSGPLPLRRPPRPSMGSVVELSATSRLNGDALDAWTDELRDDAAGRLWRLQGLVHVAGCDSPLACVGMRSHIAGSSCRIPLGHSPEASVLSVVGDDLDALRIEAAFAQMVGG
jgi:G3E family GTPase